MAAVANTWGIQDWDTVFTQAQSVLSPAQLNAMKSMQATYPAGMNAVKEALALQPPVIVGLPVQQYISLVS